MRLRLRDRHLYGAGAAACAVCCAPPVLALLGIAGAGIAATIATAAFAGIVFALVVAGAPVFALVQRKRVALLATERPLDLEPHPYVEPGLGRADRHPPREAPLAPRVLVAEIGGAWLVWQGVRDHRGWVALLR